MVDRDREKGAMADGGGLAVAAGAIVNGRGGGFAATAQLTEQQQAFVSALVSNGGNGTAAAEAAGYANPRQEAWRLQTLDVVATAIRAERSKRLQRMSLKALGSLEAVMNDPDASNRDKIAAARTTLEAAGMLGKAAQKGEEDWKNKPLAEMTPDELLAFISATRAQNDRLREAQAKVIDGSAEVVPEG